MANTWPVQGRRRVGVGVEAARTVSTSEMSAIGWSSGTCAHSSASTCAARGRGVQGEQHSRSRRRESGRLHRPGPASHLLASRPLLRGLLLGHRDEARAATGARPTLVRALGRGAGRGWGVRGEARASAQHREHPVHRLAVARGLVHVLEVQVLPRHAHATQGSARVLTGALPLGGEWGWAGQGAVCFARRGQSRTPGSRWKMKGPL